MTRTLTSLRPVAMGSRVIIEGQTYQPADDVEEKDLLATKRWRVATKEDVEAWKTRLSSDPVLAERLAADDAASKPAPQKLTGKAKAEADAKAKEEADAAAKAEADAAAKAEADAKTKVEADAVAKVEGDSKPGASIGPGGIG
ncbi:hypothetical protein [Hyphomonas sp.]|uniref:hypothetical protein n=1 Tax=Hyphomonas sp. TaxID=87 RepID=UPI0025C3873D|nr:hypothetical protein [Hyphomonas sp.]